MPRRNPLLNPFFEEEFPCNESEHSRWIATLKTASPKRRTQASPENDGDAHPDSINIDKAEQNCAEWPRSLQA